MKLNEFLKTKRLNQGKNIHQFADELCVPHTTVIHYESRDYLKAITPLLASKICEAYDLEPYDLFDYEFEMKNVDNKEEFIKKTYSYFQSPSNLKNQKKSSLKNFYDCYLKEKNYQNYIDPLWHDENKNESFFADAYCVSKNDNKEAWIIYLAPYVVDNRQSAKEQKLKIYEMIIDILANSKEPNNTIEYYFVTSSSVLFFHYDQLVNLKRIKFDYAKVFLVYSKYRRPIIVKELLNGEV